MFKRVPLPRLLGSALEEWERLHPMRLSIQETLTPVSSATMTLPPGETASVRDLIALYTAFGFAGIYRVSSAAQSADGETTLELEHAITTLRDSMMPGERTISGTPRAVLGEILASQQGPARWALGDCQAQETTLVSAVQDTNTLEALLDVLEQLDGVYLAFDQTGTTWLLHVRALPAEVSCEGRLSRNLSGVTITRNDEELCTRVYAQGLGEHGYLQDDAAVGRWGVVSRAFTCGEGEALPLRTAAERYLKERSSPAIGVEIDGYDLSAATGVALDHFALGQICRIVLPDRGECVEERVTAITVEDVYGDPERVRVTLANQTSDASSRIAGLITRTTQLQRQGATQREIIRTVEENLYEAREEILLRATKDELVLVNDALTHRISEAEVHIDGANAAIALRATRTEVQELGQEFDKRVTQAEVRIDGANAAISLKADATTVSGLESRVSSAEISIDGMNGEIALKVSKNGVISSINQSAESVTISASRINLSGYVTASSLNAEIASINKFFTGNATAGAMRITTLNVSDALTFKGTAIGFVTFTVTLSSGTQQRVRCLGTTA